MQFVLPPKDNYLFIHVPGRKLKRFGAMKTLSLASSLMFQSHMAMPNDSQALTAVTCIPSIREVQFSQQIITILENIEPEVVCAGHDNMQPDVPHLLNSLNRLCEKQLLWIVKWSKSLPGNSSQHRDPMKALHNVSGVIRK